MRISFGCWCNSKCARTVEILIVRSLDLITGLDSVNDAEESTATQQQFSMGAKVFVTMLDGVGSRRAGRISHAHKDGTYAVTFEDADALSETSSTPTREKHIPSSRIELIKPTVAHATGAVVPTIDADSEGWTPVTGVGDANASGDCEQRKILDNLRLLDQIEAADRKTQEQAATERRKEAQKKSAASAKSYARGKDEGECW